MDVTNASENSIHGQAAGAIPHDGTGEHRKHHNHELPINCAKALSNLTHGSSPLRVF
jgi:hypothetical protein